MKDDKKDKETRRRKASSLVNMKAQVGLSICRTRRKHEAHSQKRIEKPFMGRD